MKIRTVVFHILAILALTGVTLPSQKAIAAPLRQETGGRSFGQSVVQPTQVQVSMSSEQPKMTPEQMAQKEASLAQSRLPGPVTPIGPGATTRNAPPINPETPIGNAGAKAAGTFTIFSNSSLAGGPSRSEVSEPSVANNGRDIFATYNSYAALSTNYGTSWTYTNPATAFPASYNGFCCDQDVFYDPSRDLTFWLLQYSANVSTGNALRLAVAKGQANLESGTWYYYDFTPSGFGGLASDWFDFPQLTRTNNNLYLSANAYSSVGAFKFTTMFRLPLDQLSAGGAVTYDYDTASIRFNYTAAQGGTDTLYYASHIDTTHLEVATWPEGVAPGSITYASVAHASYLTSAHDCTVTASTKNPCGFDDDRVITGWLRRSNNELGFMWDAPQGTDGLGTFAYPYAKVLTMNATTKAVITDVAIWNSTVAWLMPSSGANARGHVGGTIASAGGAYQPSCSAWLYDDYSAGITPLEIAPVSAGDTSPAANRWGDYLRTRQSGANPFQFIGTCYAIEASVVTPRVVRFGRERDTFSRNYASFTGHTRSDVVVYRGGAWLMYDFITGSNTSGVWTGAPGSCIPAPMDYDGDGTVKFTQLCGNAWHFYNKNGTYNKGIWIGLPGAVPVPADYQGLGKDQVVVFSGGAWQFYDFATGLYQPGSSVWTGMPAHWTGGTDVPVPMDYNGDGKADFTVYAGGPWHFYNANGTYNKGIWTGGTPGDIPVAGDYHGNNKDEVVVFSGGAWQFYDFATGLYLPSSSVWTGRPAHWTGGVSMPAPLDYNGDGKLDFTVFSGGPWHFFNANGSYNKGIWTGGVAGDLAISRRYLP